MKTFESYQNNKLFKLGGRIGDLMILSGLWLLCSLPIVTLGCSTAALYYGTVKCFGSTDMESGETARAFLHSFKDNLKQGILLTLLYLLDGALVAADIYFSRNGISGFTLPPFYEKLVYVLILPVVFTLPYIFPYISRFDNTMKNCLKNSFLFSAMNLSHTLGILLLGAAALAVAVLFPPFAIVTPALAALLSSKMIEKDFKQASQTEGEDENEADEEDYTQEDEENESSTDPELD